MPRIFIAGLFHETHSFLDSRTGLDDFETARGEELLSCQGDSSPMGGALECFSQRGYELVLGPYFRAVPSGIVEDRVVEHFWSDFFEAWDPSADGVFLVLHGAMVSETMLDVEGEILRRIRALPGAWDLPVYGVYDLHANFTPDMASRANCLIAYRENPHSDARESSIRAAALLDDFLKNGSGKPPKTAFLETEFVWAPTITGTADDPMNSLENRARDLESEFAENGILAVNVNAGFAFADTPNTGVSFTTVMANSAPDISSRLLGELAELAKSLSPEDQQISELSVSQAMAQISTNPVEGVTVLTEPSDNIGGGAPGDATGLLRALIDHKIENAAIAIWDPKAVSMLQSVSVGDLIALEIGGKGSRFDPGPVEVEVELMSKSDGRFELVDKNSHLASMSGDFFEMGPSAVVKKSGLTILLTSERVPPFDPGQWISQGIDPAKLSVIAVKAAVAHRRGYDPFTARTFAVDTPGPCSSDLSQFEFRYLEKKI